MVNVSMNARGHWGSLLLRANQMRYGLCHSQWWSLGCSRFLGVGVKPLAKLTTLMSTCCKRKTLFQGNKQCT